MAGEQGGSGLSARSAAGPVRAAEPARGAQAAAPQRPARPNGAPTPTPARPAARTPTRAAAVPGSVPGPGAARPAASRPAPARSAPARTEAPAPRPQAPRPVERTPARPAVRAAAPPPAPAPPPPPVRRPRAEPERAPATVAVPESRVAYVSVVEASRRTGASVSTVRGWVRDGQVRSRTGTGPRGERVEVAVADVERLTAERPPAPARRPARRRAEVAVVAPAEPEAGVDSAPGASLVPLQTVEAMERLSGELYLAGQRAARAEAVAELRDRRLGDLQQEVDDLQLEATGLWEQNQELLRRVAVAEAQVLALQQQLQAQAQAQASSAQQSGGDGAGEPKWRLRRTPPGS